MNTAQTQEAAKLNYLYSFEAAFRAKCAAACIDASKWSQGMWTNAHMHFGGGLSVEDGVARWFAHVNNVEKPKMRKYPVDKSALPS
jgi:hypothetical protein